MTKPALRSLLAIVGILCFTAAASCHADEPPGIDGLVMQTGQGASLSAGCVHDSSCLQPLRCIKEVCVVPPGLDGDLVLPDTPALVLDVGGLDRKITLEVADDSFERSRGLMWRKRMGAEWGMLFIFPREGMRSFWMRNTHLSLDMLFIDAKGKVVNIARNAKPLSDDPHYPSTSPAKYVLELNAGYADAHGIKAGQQVHFVGVPGVHDPALSE